jgi:sterol desaturase/sphingolipid hydroxylase (fatty acid hydroxylase superfamily)
LLFEHATSIQLGLFIATLVGLWGIEARFMPLCASKKLAHTARNCVFIATALPIQLAMSGACVFAAHAVAEHHWGLNYLLPISTSTGLRYALLFVALDFFDFVYHVSMHKIPLFWRFHRTHHTDGAPDVSTTIREHPGETFVRNLYLVLWVFVTGAPVEVLVLRQLAETAVNPWAHTALRLPDTIGRLVGWLIVTPNVHRVHHHAYLPFTDRNYGDVFTLWDRLFGTFVELPESALRFGVETRSAMQT